MLRTLIALALVVGMAGARAATPTPEGRSATAGERALLEEAVLKTVRDFPRWAYTETRVVRDHRGKTKDASVVRYDPSQPYAQQWTPISIDGKAPSAKDVARYARRGSRSRSGGAKPDAIVRRQTLGELIELENARVVTETPAHLVFELALRRTNNKRFPPEKFQVLARIDRVKRTLENVAVTLREPFRVKLVAKVKSGEGSLEFTTVESQRAPTLTSIEGDASVSILFVNVGGKAELKRTDFKWVKPFDERFEVQIGTLKALDF